MEDEKVDEYIHALERFYQTYYGTSTSSSTSMNEKSIWFKGQLLFINLSGAIVKEVRHLFVYLFI